MIEYIELIIAYFALLIFFCGRIMGKRLDIEYRDPDGKPLMFILPAKWKWIFSFRYSTGNNVVKAGVIAHIVGYAFSGTEVLLLAYSFVAEKDILTLIVACVLLVLFFVVDVFVVMLPFSLQYNRNIQEARDCDWITQMQEALTIYPKRRCKIIQIIDPQICMIRISITRSRFLARTTNAVTVGDRLYAVHSNEQGRPFWTVKTH